MLCPASQLLNCTARFRRVPKQPIYGRPAPGEGSGVCTCLEQDFLSLRQYRKLEEHWRFEVVLDPVILYFRRLDPPLRATYEFRSPVDRAAENADLACPIYRRAYAARSQPGTPKTLVGFCRAHPLARKENDAIATGELWERVDFLPASEAERPAAIEKKRDVGAKSRCQMQHLIGRESPAGKQRDGAQNNGCVTAGPAQAAAGRDPLVEQDIDSCADLAFGQSSFRRSDGQVGNPRRDIKAFQLKPHFPSARSEPDVQLVCQRNGLEDGAQLVEAVGTAPEDCQAQVDLCAGFERNLFHGGDEKRGAGNPVCV